MVHLQVMQWQSLDLHCLDATEWGWRMEKGHLAPIKTDLNVAQEFLLNFVSCNCQTASKKYMWD